MESLIFHILMPLVVCFSLSSIAFIAATYAETHRTMNDCRNWGFGFMGFGILISVSHWLQAVF